MPPKSPTLPSPTSTTTKWPQLASDSAKSDKCTATACASPARPPSPTVLPVPQLELPASSAKLTTPSRRPARLVSAKLEFLLTLRRALAIPVPSTASPVMQGEIVSVAVQVSTSESSVTPQGASPLVDITKATRLSAASVLQCVRSAPQLPSAQPVLQTTSSMPQHPTVNPAHSTASLAMPVETVLHATLLMLFDSSIPQLQDACLFLAFTRATSTSAVNVLQCVHSAPQQ